MHELIHLLIRLVFLSLEDRCNVCDAPFRRSRYRWTIRGQTAYLCPNCNSRLERQRSRLAFDPGTVIDVPYIRERPATKPPRSSGVTIVFVLLIIAGSGYFLWFFAHKTETPSSGVVTGPSPTTASASSSTAPASPSTPITTPAPNHVVPTGSAVMAAQREAMRLYPALGVAGSAFNRAFLARYKQYQQQRPEYFRDPDWPVKLARETAASTITR